MKRRTLLLAALAATLGLASCSDDDDKNTTRWVDLGLPSGLLWAESNVGATAPEGLGGLYAWAETRTKATYGWDTYAYYADGAPSVYTPADGLATLRSADDAATVAQGGDARTPSVAEWEELLAHCSGTWSTHDGTPGLLLAAPNGNALFLPANASRWDEEVGDASVYGSYWSATLDGDTCTGAWYLFFNADTAFTSTYGVRADGRSVRAVRSSR